MSRTRQPQHAGAVPRGQRSVRESVSEWGTSTRSSRIVNALNVGLGLWVISSPWALGYGEHVRVDVHHLVTGAGVVVLALNSLVRPRVSAPWSVGTLFLAAWLALSQYVLDYSTIADTEILVLNNLLTSAAITVCALWSIKATGRGRRPGVTSQS